ncbi:hypothetical protein BaRGS_00002531, partial [Batillaria attramentaria]
ALLYFASHNLFLLQVRGMGGEPVRNVPVTLVKAFSLCGGRVPGGTVGIVLHVLTTVYLPPPCLRYIRDSTEAGRRRPASDRRHGCSVSPYPKSAPRIPWVRLAGSVTWRENHTTCLDPFDGPGEVKYVRKSLLASGTGARMHDVIPQYVATLDSELGDDDPFDVQVVTLGTNQIPPRRYDLTDLGDPLYFQGWADVQGTGAANDYCRVIGKGKRRFLSCALAGTRGQGHQYVSKLGFDAGHNGTWFMRDVDSDGRDDYCRCIGEASASHIVCMKAGEKGFYGSTIQGGSENTFELPGSQGCHHKRLNPHFGL